MRARLHQARRDRNLGRRLGFRECAAASDAPLLNFAAKRLVNGWLIVVTNAAPRTALNTYRQRWAIECLFGYAITRGLNLEDTRLRDPPELDLLMRLSPSRLPEPGAWRQTISGTEALGGRHMDTTPNPGSEPASTTSETASEQLLSKPAYTGRRYGRIHQSPPPA